MKYPMLDKILADFKMFTNYGEYLKMLAAYIDTDTIQKHEDFIKKSFDMDVSIPSLVKDLEKKVKSTPITSKLLSKKIKSASSRDVEDLARLEKELVAVSRRVGRLVKTLEQYVVVPTKIHLIPSDLALYAGDVSDAKDKLQGVLTQESKPSEEEG